MEGDVQELYNIISLRSQFSLIELVRFRQAELNRTRLHIQEIWTLSWGEGRAIMHHDVRKNVVGASYTSYRSRSTGL